MGTEPHVKAQPGLVPRLLTVADAARLLGSGRTTADDLIAAGQLAVVHTGRSACVPTTKVDDFVQRLRVRREGSEREPHGRRPMRR